MGDGRGDGTARVDSVSQVDTEGWDVEYLKGFDDAGTYDLCALVRVGGVVGGRDALVQSQRKEGRDRGGACFSRCSLCRRDPAVCVSIGQSHLWANAALAIWPCDELDIGRAGGRRSFVHVV